MCHKRPSKYETCEISSHLRASDMLGLLYVHAQYCSTSCKRDDQRQSWKCVTSWPTSVKEATTLRWLWRQDPACMHQCYCPTSRSSQWQFPVPAAASYTASLRESLSSIIYRIQILTTRVPVKPPKIALPDTFLWQHVARTHW
jgi:hypothetical protein